ncbi:MAG: zinc ribbon domain-containing protein [Clostridia bacterium]|nr:zinc ribbon domain-containing protein [Clostridia bacterium]
MTRDLCYYFERSYLDVYNAFLWAAKDKFGKDCKQEEGKVITFGLNYSFRYNMNGGAIRVFFMPYATGTAVNLHYIIAQLYGARYGAHAKDLIAHVERTLCVQAVEMQPNLQAFLDFQPTPALFAPPMQPPMQAPVQQPAPQPNTQKCCVNCGQVLTADSLFCSSCGTKVEPPKFCANCGKPFNGDEKFCPACGAKR